MQAQATWPLNIATRADLQASTYVSVKASPYRAKGDGIADDTASVRKAIAAVVAAGGGTVYFPPGTYRFATVTGANDAFLDLSSNLTLLGAGDATILKAADGLNTDGDFRFLVGEDVDNVTIANLKFDCNGQNNPVPLATPGKGNQCVYILKGRGHVIQNVTIVNNAGRQCIHYGDNTNPQKVSDLFIENVRVRNVGTAVSGNANQTDHSVFYIQAQYFEIRGCVVRNDSLASEATAYEIHSSFGTVGPVEASLFGTGFNVVAQVNDQKGVNYVDAQIDRCLRPVRFWCFSGFTMERVRLKGCNFIQNAASTNQVIDANAQVQAGSTMRDCEIVDCTIQSEVTDYTRSLHGVLVGRQQDLRIRANRFRNIAGRAISLGSILADELDLRIEDNDMIDCGLDAGSGNERAFIGLNSADAIGRLRVEGNAMRGSVVGTADTSNGSPTLTSVSNTAEWAVNDPINGVGIPDGTTVTGVDTGANELTLSANATASASGVTIFKHGRYGVFSNADIDYGQITDNDFDRDTIGLEGGVGVPIELTGTATAIRIQRYELTQATSPNGTTFGTPYANAALHLQASAVAQFIVWIGGSIANFFLWTATQLQVATAGVVRLLIDAGQLTPNNDAQMNNATDQKRWKSTYTRGLAVRYNAVQDPDVDEFYIQRAGGGGDISLPAANQSTGRIYMVEVTGSSTLDLIPDGADTINGAAANYTAAVGLHFVISDNAGTGWRAFQIA